jgi:UDP-N-acetylmuramoyl-tripeptide--D-alanyl-D-alanine ligase
MAGVAEEEGWLAELLPPEGKLFVNGDGEWMERVVRRSAATIIRAGLREANDWRASGVQLDEHGARFRVNGPKAWISGEYRINLIGRHQVVNALLAVAVAAEMGLTRAEIQNGLLECKPAKMRMQAWDWNGVCVLDDAYNANADSMVAALRTLREMPCGGRRVAVLGDMAELGAHSRQAHEEAGGQAAECGVDQLFTFGTMAAATAEAARSAGIKAASHFTEMAALAEAVKQFLKPNDVILLKASRSMRMERLGEALRASVGKKV